MNFDVTKAVSEYVKEKGIQITVLSEGTGIPYNALQPSMTHGRKLRAEEFLSICKFLEVSPWKFWKNESNTKKIND